MQVMLAGKVKDVNELNYPLLASVKLDGIRAFVHGGRLMSRKFKPIPNVHVQAKFAGLPEGLDGELILGDLTAEDAFRKTTSAVMSDDKEVGKDVVFHVFDSIGDGGFSTRFERAGRDLRFAGGVDTTLVSHKIIHNAVDLLAMETAALAAGHEGLMVRSMDGEYKHGRATTKEGTLLKLKRFEDGEAIVLDSIELQHNGNEAIKDELGHTKRSSAAAGKTGRGMLGKFVVRDMETGVEFEIGTGQGLTLALRQELWLDRPALVGKIVKYKHFVTGSKDKPRFPIFHGFRDARDM